MPKSAYPKDYELGPDNQGWLMKIKNKIQVWFTGGPRVPSGFWKWREIPLTLFGMKGNGYWRVENTDGSVVLAAGAKRTSFVVYPIHHVIESIYTSRIQPWCRWHFALMWPLGIHWSIIWRQKNVVRFPTYKSNFGISRMFAGYLGWIRDSDKIYKPKVYMGGNFE